MLTLLEAEDNSYQSTRERWLLRTMTFRAFFMLKCLDFFHFVLCYQFCTWLRHVPISLVQMVSYRLSRAVLEHN